MHGRDTLEKDVALYIYVVGFKLEAAHMLILCQTLQSRINESNSFSFNF